MEELLTKVNLLNKCMQKYSQADANKMSKTQNREMCLNEKIAFNSHLFSDKMQMKNLIPERIEIMQAKESKTINDRRAYMDNLTL